MSALDQAIAEVRANPNAALDIRDENNSTVAVLFGVRAAQRAFNEINQPTQTRSKPTRKQRKNNAAHRRRVEADERERQKRQRRAVHEARVAAKKRKPSQGAVMRVPTRWSA